MFCHLPVSLFIWYNFFILFLFVSTTHISANIWQAELEHVCLVEQRSICVWELIFIRLQLFDRPGRIYTFCWLTWIILFLSFACIVVYLLCSWVQPFIRKYLTSRIRTYVFSWTMVHMCSRTYFHSSATTW